MGASTLKKTRALNVWGQTKKSVEGLVAEGKVAIKKKISQLTEPVWWLVIMSQYNDSNRYSNIYCLLQLWLYLCPGRMKAVDCLCGICLGMFQDPRRRGIGMEG